MENINSGGIFNEFGVTGEIPGTGTFGIFVGGFESVVSSGSTVFNSSVFTFVSVVHVVTFGTR